MSDRPTFSPFWHRVRAMKPRLRPHVQITRQYYRGQRWHVVHDPATNQFYRLSPIAHEFVCMLDGKREVEHVWDSTLSRHGDDAPTQNEIIQLLSQLYNSNLLSVEASPETEQLLGRGRERTRKKVQQQAIGLMYFKIKLFNPDRILTLLEPVLRPILNKWGFFAWCAWVLIAAIAVLPHWEALQTGFGSAIAPSNWAWMIAVFIVVKLIHETGHGVICKRFGGQVPEFGVMMLVLLPAPYVDASACWAFPSKWQRMAVGAGGMIFELFVAGVAAFLWLNSHEGQLIHQLAYNAMLTASVSTVLFNANPLMRFDGYYILSDLIEVPNLMQRSFNMLKHLAQKYIYRIRDIQPPSSDPTEQSILIVYGLGAMAYRVFLFFSITLYLMGQLFGLGLILAVWTAVMWFVLPVGGFVHWLATNPKLAEFRPRAILTSLGLIVLGAIAIGLIPAPDHRRGVGVIESAQRSGVFYRAEGFVETAYVRPGDRVNEGDPIVQLKSNEIHAQLANVTAMIQEAAAVERDAMRSGNEAAAQVARDRQAMLESQRAVFADRVSRLTVRAPHPGVIVGADPAASIGSFVKEGDGLCEVVDIDELRVAAVLTQSEASWLFELAREQYDVEMRLASDVSRVIDGANVRVVDSGQRELPHAGLGYGGGGTFETKQDDKHGRATKGPQFKAFIEAKDPALLAQAGAPGEKVALRFTLPYRPLIGQWVDRLQKLIQGRVNI